MAELLVLLENRVAGTATFADNRLGFAYSEEWRAAPDAYPLSLSMPLTQRVHGDAAIRAFIWNLLPDNEQTLERWAKQFHVSARNPFALIREVGEDCAGAVQFVRPERLDALRAGGEDAIQWLDEAEIGARLRSVLKDAGSGRTAGENGQFSLAGAQPKTALLLESGRWGVPSGRIPTTHILKPPAPDLPGHAENEHVCLRLAEAMGLVSAASEVRAFDGQLAIVVARYDRTPLADGGLLRLHQEDMCQALAVLPWKKYQNDGGPTAADIARLIATSVRSPFAAGAVVEDLWRFVDSLIFNWLIGGTDAHAKNYGFLLAQDTVRLAPLYDIASAFALPELQPQRMKLAMKIEYYLIERVHRRHWARWAPSAGLDPDAVVARIEAMARDLPEKLAEVIRTARGEGLAHEAIDRLERLLPERAEAVLRV